MICAVAVAVGAGEAVAGAVAGAGGAGMSKEAVSGIGTGMSSEQGDDDEIDEFNGDSAEDRSRYSVKHCPGDPGESGAKCVGENGGGGVVL
jgi:hypothetical protein